MRNRTENETWYAACPRCISFSQCEEEQRAESVVNSHNENAHDGNDIAGTLNAKSIESIVEFVKQAKDVSKGNEFQKFLNEIRNGSSAFFVSANQYREIERGVDLGEIS